MQASNHVIRAELSVGFILLDAMKKVLAVTDGETPIVPPFEVGGYTIDSGSFDVNGSNMLVKATFKLLLGKKKEERSPYLIPSLTITLPKESIEKALAELIIENDIKEMPWLDHKAYTAADFSFKWSAFTMTTANAANEPGKVMAKATYPIKATVKAEESTRLNGSEPHEEKQALQASPNLD